MRILLASTAAATIAITATPAFAQYGGSPAQQVEGAPAGTDMAPAPEDEGMPAGAAGEALAPEVDPDPDLDVDTDLAADTGGVAGGGKPAFDGEDYALADMDADAPDMDVDADLDVDTDMDADEADEAADDVGPNEQGEPSE